MEGIQKRRRCIEKKFPDYKRKTACHLRKCKWHRTEQSGKKKYEIFYCVPQIMHPVGCVSFQLSYYASYFQVVLISLLTNIVNSYFIVKYKIIVLCLNISMMP